MYMYNYDKIIDKKKTKPQVSWVGPIVKTQG